ncbi:MAG: sigma 54-interacting transcriptional regulator [Pseudomonadota bacterium]
MNARNPLNESRPVGVVAGRHKDGRTLLTYDSDAHHAEGPRARALVFADPKSRAMLPLIDKVAPSEANILIVGETGTGKELVARFVHDRSNRAKSAFVAVNCGAFSEALIEGELFGYERGAFTGAQTAREGWFEAANGGTLFLDEIGELPAALQVKLLRVLQEREVVRLGSRTPIRLDIRIIAATNVDLQQAVDAGTFRSDLFYRLQVVALPLLPLRERPADILPLAQHFLAIYGTRVKASRLELTPAAEEALFHYAWPGNIRELENAIHRATLVCQEGRIEAGDLVLGARLAQSAPPSAASNDPAAAPEEQVRALVGQLLDGRHPDLLDSLVATAVTEAFRRSGSNQIKTAEALGVTRNVVRTYLKNLDLI